MVLERTSVTDYSGPGYDIGAGRAFGGIVGMFAILGLGLAIFAFAAAYGIDVPESTDDAANAAAGDVGRGLLGLLVGVVPIVAAPILALGTGAWAGHATKTSGEGFVAGGLGGVVGTLALFLVVGIGFALGAAASGVPADLGNVDFGLAPGLASTFGYFASLAGIVYLLVVFLIGGLCGALVGALVARGYGVHRTVSRRTAV